MEISKYGPFRTGPRRPNPFACPPAEDGISPRSIATFSDHWLLPIGGFPDRVESSLIVSRGRTNLPFQL